MKKIRSCAALLMLAGAACCVSPPKYNGIQELLAAHPKGSIDARDASDESRLFLQDLMLYVNELEYELERPR